MKQLSQKFLLIFYVLSVTACSSVATTEEKKVQILPPNELYGDLFYDVQADGELFSDSKTFVDAVPIHDVDEIRKDYRKLKPKTEENISEFLDKNFRIPKATGNYVTDSSSVNTHISKLWKVLKRPADEQVSGTLIPLPNPYIVPGGRFREIYYWDSYFTMLGLQEDGEIEPIRNMIDNFSYLIDKYGFIPNGNRTYYLGRSQPPFYASMVGLLAGSEGEQVYAHYLEYLIKEYNFWMNGIENLNDQNEAFRRVVRMPDGEILNRYYDDIAAPRPESYREDVKTAEKAVAMNPQLTKEEVYRNLRASAESGWDFSSRWLSKGENGQFQLSTIHTTDIVPVDLNSLLFNLEQTIAKAYEVKGNQQKAEEFRGKAAQRKAAIQKYLWKESKNFYFDYNFRSDETTGIFSLAGLYPLFFNIPTNEQALKVADTVEDTFLRPGGVVTTPNETGEQWDAPNGWAPLEYITIEGLRNYQKDVLANEIQERWLQLNQRVYGNTYKMLEKYNVEDLSKESGGGEYPTQDGFGWTNGVYQKLSKS
ncbi:MAG: alpha,alpha-trehalase TreF [Salegentibacter sp.]